MYRNFDLCTSDPSDNRSGRKIRKLVPTIPGPVRPEKPGPYLTPPQVVYLTAAAAAAATSAAARALSRVNQFYRG